MQVYAILCTWILGCIQDIYILKIITLIGFGFGLTLNRTILDWVAKEDDQATMRVFFRFICQGGGE